PNGSESGTPPAALVGFKRLLDSGSRREGRQLPDLDYERRHPDVATFGMDLPAADKSDLASLQRMPDAIAARDPTSARKHDKELVKAGLVKIDHPRRVEAQKGDVDIICPTPQGRNVGARARIVSDRGQG